MPWRKRKTEPKGSWFATVKRLPILTGLAFRHGALPVVGSRALKTARSEGLTDLHWKVLGDSLAKFFQSTGPVLTKLGQILATRNDLLPDAVCARLETLYSEQPAMSDRERKRILKAAYPKGIPFQRLEKEPIAVGSVGQVHRGTLQDGSPVIIKMIRPGARSLIDQDIQTAFTLLDTFFALAGKRNEPTRLMIKKVLEDLQTGFVSELDLENEARSIEDFRERLKSNPRVYVPRCYSEVSSKHVLVIEELKGEPLSALRERAKSDPAAAKRAAELALKEILTQVFDTGRFHADPHAGNLMILEDGRLGLIDFGLTGEFTRKDRRQIARAVKALLSRDADAVIDALLEFGSRPDDFDLKAFKADLVAVLGNRKENIKSQNLDTLVNDLFKVSYRHRIYVPQSTTLLIKTLVTIEGVARSLDPDISLISAAVPVVLKSLTPKWLRLGGLFRR